MLHTFPTWLILKHRQIHIALSSKFRYDFLLPLQGKRSKWRKRKGNGIRKPEIKSWLCKLLTIFLKQVILQNEILLWIFKLMSHHDTDYAWMIMYQLTRYQALFWVLSIYIQKKWKKTLPWWALYFSEERNNKHDKHNK